MEHDEIIFLVSTPRRGECLIKKKEIHWGRYWHTRYKTEKKYVRNLEIHEGKERLFQERNAAKEPSETGWPWIVHCLKHLQLSEVFHRNYVDKSLNALILFCILGIWERGIVTKINECLKGDLLLIE